MRNGPPLAGLFVSDAGIKQIESAGDAVAQMGIVAQLIAHPAQTRRAEKADHHPILPFGEDEGNGKTIERRDTGRAGWHDGGEDARVKRIDGFALKDQESPPCGSR